MSAVAALGLLAGLLGVACMVPYLRDTVRGSTRPHRGTWLIWCALGIVVCASQRADGASWSLALTGGQVALNALVIVLAIRLGTGGVSRAEAVLMALAGGGVAGWLVVDEPVVATACAVGADLIATGMMVPKTWRDPRSETRSTFALASLAGLAALGSVGALEPALLLYPLYYCLVNGGLALLIHQRRAAVERAGWAAPAPPLAARPGQAVAP
jgi:hypothetical protein